PVSATARFARPVADPASMTYDVGEPDALGLQPNVTVEPLTMETRFAGALGAAVQGPVPRTMNDTSLDAGPTPALLAARIRTKYVPGTTPVAVMLVAVLPVAKLARSGGPPAFDDAWMMYEVAAGEPDGRNHDKVTVEPTTCGEKRIGASGSAEL